MTPHTVTLRDVYDSDLPIFFEQQREPEGVRMAAFTRLDPSDRAAFDAHWVKIRADKNTINKTILADGQVAGSIFSWLWDDQRELGYWLDKAYWGRGIATDALRLFLQEVVTERPLYSAAAKDNAASLRVLQKCGFEVTGSGRAFANGRGEEIDELYLKLE
jgi:RimJ/RimL family protein N-acetyltransferase